MHTHTLLRHSTVALIVTASIAAVISLSVAQGVPPENRWQTVNPKLLPVDMVGRGLKIKMGRSYKFVNYDKAEQAKLGVQYLWKPREANAKRVLTFYDLSKLSLKDWVTIDKATPDGDPPLTAFLVPVGDDTYVGMPFKWNQKINAATRAAVSREKKYPAIKASETLKIFADNLISLGAAKQVMPVLQGRATGPTWDEILASYNSAGIKYADIATGWTAKEIGMIEAGNPAPIMAKQPEIDIYIAFDREFENLSIQPLGRVISVSGLGGERLGYIQQAWPTEKSESPSGK